ncbi:lipase [Amycolatopsis cynarae]|uniref:Lipase n=1 Tax=Amycolatopsis cynarae TaxID=2995223 RepID=A0ABY7B0G4_9PSEU|nr:lipase family protein [Amycolatopsis sp. HUAS 11-8]WAL65777.1 lipase [Amycolatopsis sp. HUAS 11-8]
MRRWRFLAIFTSVLGAVSLAVTAPAGAADFYDPPSPLPAGSSGDVIRHQPTQFFLDPAKLIPAPASAQRIMYRSTDEHGAPIAVTGTVLTPTAAWTGPGARPIISYAAGTQGLGDQCAPSKAMAAGLEYEGPFIAGLLSRGYGIVITDYEGLGTPGLHTYVNRKAEGYAVLDAIRAAQRLPEAGLPADGPVGISGYSQGGGASAAAAELQPAYAPELKLKGAYAGAVPADLGAVAALGDGSYAVGFTLFAVASMNYSYPELNVPALLNDKGKQVLQAVATECTADALLKHAFTRTADLTADGRPLTAYLGEEPFASALREQRIGLTPPKVPMLVAHSSADDIVPFDQGRAMARAWCAEGATVQFDTLSVPTHIGGAVAGAPLAFSWLDQLFQGQAVPSNCGSF